MLSFFTEENRQRRAALEQRRYDAGYRAGLQVKQASKPTSVYALEGRLYVSQSGWLLLDVPNSLVRGLFAAMAVPGIELPPGRPDFSAHISVMTREEVEQIGAEKINERGKRFPYQLGPIKTVDPKGWKEMAAVYFVEVASPALKKLRASYGLSPLPRGDHEFHITVAVRRKGVLQANDVSKAAELQDVTTRSNDPDADGRRQEMHGLPGARLLAGARSDFHGDDARHWGNLVLAKLAAADAKKSVAGARLLTRDDLKAYAPDERLRKALLPIFEREAGGPIDTAAAYNFRTNHAVISVGDSVGAYSAIEAAAREALPNWKIEVSDEGGVPQGPGWRSVSWGKKADVDERGQQCPDGECCPHCHARLERGDDGKCNRCGKPWPQKIAAPALRVDLTPEQILTQTGKPEARLGSMKAWPAHWKPHGEGWMEWFNQYHQGRRLGAEDDRQIKRQESFRARHGAQFAKRPTPRRGHALRNWGIDPLQLLPEDQRATFAEAMQAYAEQQLAKTAGVSQNTATRDGVTYDIDRLVAATKGRSVEKIPLKDLPRPPRASSTGFSKHRYSNVNMDKPILVGEDGTLWDGRHRLLRHLDEGKTHIKAVRVTKEDLKEAKMPKRTEPGDLIGPSRIGILPAAEKAAGFGDLLRTAANGIKQAPRVAGNTAKFMANVPKEQPFWPSTGTGLKNVANMAFRPRYPGLDRTPGLTNELRGWDRTRSLAGTGLRTAGGLALAGTVPVAYDGMMRLQPNQLATDLHNATFANGKGPIDSHDAMQALQQTFRNEAPSFYGNVSGALLKRWTGGLLPTADDTALTKMHAAVASDMAVPLLQDRMYNTRQNRPGFMAAVDTLRSLTPAGALMTAGIRGFSGKQDISGRFAESLKQRGLEFGPTMALDPKQITQSQFYPTYARVLSTPQGAALAEHGIDLGVNKVMQNAGGAAAQLSNLGNSRMFNSIRPAVTNTVNSAVTTGFDHIKKLLEDPKINATLRSNATQVTDDALRRATQYGMGGIGGIGLGHLAGTSLGNVWLPDDSRMSKEDREARARQRSMLDSLATAAGAGAGAYFAPQLLSRLGMR